MNKIVHPFLLVFSCIFSYSCFSEHTIYITPGEFGDLFAIDHPWLSRDDCLRPLYEMRQEVRRHGFEIEQTTSLKNLSDVKFIIVFDALCAQAMCDLQLYPLEKRILFLWEPPTVKPENYNPAYHALFYKVFTWWDDLVDNRTYFKFYYPQPRLHMIDTRIPFNEKKLSVMIAKRKCSSHPAQLYSERMKVIHFFEQTHPELFDLYGFWWESLALTTYKGPTARKVDILKKYKFCFCFENINGLHGYITEKIFDSFIAGSVPIYLGAANISTVIPQECFIDYRNYASLDHLVRDLTTMNEKEYGRYIDAIHNFLQSDRVKNFSTDYFVQLFVTYFTSGES